jgi:V/A-type H+-transporting ATPase subunit D
MALLAARGRLALAEQGRQLLEDKRDALLRELSREVPVAVAARRELETAAAEARLALEAARVRHGGAALAAAAAGTPAAIDVEVMSTTVMGVAVPAVSPRSLVRPADGRGRDPLATGPAVEAAAQRFEEELTIALRVATMEARVLRLAREIRRTSSRVNALRTWLIPALAAETAAIKLALEQQEREDRFRLKLVKRRRARRAVAGWADAGPAASVRPGRSPGRGAAGAARRPGTRHRTPRGPR